MHWNIVNASFQDETLRAALCVKDGLIADATTADARRFDASGLTLAPGICDVHGDGFERNLSPRPNVVFPIETALLETDKQLISNGITTAWLALTISWEPGLRSLDMARSTIQALDRIRPRLKTDVRLQLRWEAFALDAVEGIDRWLTMTPKPVLAINDHLTPMLQGERMVLKLDEYAARAGLSNDAYRDLIQKTAARKDEVPAATERLIKRAKAHGVQVFAHDEPDAATRAANRSMGIEVSEFPLSAEAARAAVQQGEETVLGAPNVLRGGSHMGALDAAPAIADGLCTVLASDYYYPAQLNAVARLMNEMDISMVRAWDLVSANAARAGGLDDRGTLTVGQRADLVALRVVDGGFDVVATFAAGHLCYLTEPDRLAA